MVLTAQYTVNSYYGQYMAPYIPRLYMLYSIAHSYTPVQTAYSKYFLAVGPSILNAIVCNDSAIICSFYLGEFNSIASVRIYVRAIFID